MSPEILDEYRRVAAELSEKYGVDTAALLDLITIHSEIIAPSPMREQLCRDPDDDKCLACAASARAVLVSGDKDLLSADAAMGIRVLSPNAFARQFLKDE